MSPGTCADYKRFTLTHALEALPVGRQSMAHTENLWVADASALAASLSIAEDASDSVRIERSRNRT